MKKKKKDYLDLWYELNPGKSFVGAISDLYRSLGSELKKVTK